MKLKDAIESRGIVPPAMRGRFTDWIEENKTTKGGQRG